MIIDLPFLLAAAALGFGLSLMLYRWIAAYNDWPMGYMQEHSPFLTSLLGLGCGLIAVAFAAARGIQLGGWAIGLFGILWAIFWLGFFRVASQLSLLLAPACAALLLFSWFGTPNFFHMELLRSSNVERVLTIPKGSQDSAVETRYEGREIMREGAREVTRDGTTGPAPRTEDPTSALIKRDLNR